MNEYANTLARATRKMIEFYAGSLHDINHFLKVHAFAALIGRLEGLDDRTQFILELSAIVHDIACPLCREKYGSAPGNRQEEESPALLKPFLAELKLAPEDEVRVVFLVAHHHTTRGVDGPDWQILLEADYLVNADESRHTPRQIERFGANVFRTSAGTDLLRSMYGGEGEPTRAAEAQ